jgi:hypothetical protein
MLKKYNIKNVMKDKIYISGAINSIGLEKATVLFNNAEKYLLSLGYDVINPLNLCQEENITWADCMLEDIKYLFQCSHIYVLSNWRVSTGARIEVGIAQELGMTIIYEEGSLFDTNVY